MRRSQWSATLAVLILGTAAAAAADLTKVERTIAKEPTYKTKGPKYCLLAFGPEAKQRVWIVLDGDDLYVDRNGNGDLTDAGERLSRQEAGFEPFAVAVGDARCRVLSVNFHGGANGEAPSMAMVRVDVAGKYRQYCGAHLAGDRAKAPVAHFGGPLTVSLRENNGVPYDKLVTGDKPAELNALVGTIDASNGCWVVLDNSEFRNDVHPVVEVEFPAKEAGGAPVRRRYELKERC